MLLTNIYNSHNLIQIACIPFLMKMQVLRHLKQVWFNLAGGQFCFCVEITVRLCPFLVLALGGYTHICRFADLAGSPALWPHVDKPDFITHGWLTFERKMENIKGRRHLWSRFDWLKIIRHCKDGSCKRVPLFKCHRHKRNIYTTNMFLRFVTDLSTKGCWMLERRIFLVDWLPKNNLLV